MTQPPNVKGRKPFQEATVRHAVSRLQALDGSRRFLVADEVGLGKTLVAQGILQYLATGPKRLNVFYVCSSLTIANQNRDNLLEVLPPEQRAGATVSVDRPTLLPWTEPQDRSAFTLFTLTPGTLPMNSSTRGRVDERASIWCLLRYGLPGAGASLARLEERLKLVQESTWQGEVNRRMQGHIGTQMAALSVSFVKEVRSRLLLGDVSDRAVADAVISLFDTGAGPAIRRLRQWLARLGLETLRPDVVILDEFQRFFEILEPFADKTDAKTSSVEPSEPQEDKDKDAEELLQLLLGSKGADAGPAILLLSATPYRPPAGAIDGGGIAHYKQFFRLLEFLYGDQARTEVPPLRTLFRTFGTLLREAGPGNQAVLAHRDDIQQRLRRVVARTERASLLGLDQHGSAPTRQQVDLSADDVRAYRHLWESASETDKSAVTPYWSSIPYPLQMMDQRYLLQRRAQPHRLPAAISAALLIRAKQVRHYKSVVSPHPRMRALLDTLSGPLLGLPWIPASLKWWESGEPFKSAMDAAGPNGVSKTLLFSRFRAVPRAVASLISFESERRVYTGGGPSARRYDYNARRRGGREDDFSPEPNLEALPAPSFNWHARQRATGDRQLDHALLTLFIPAPHLGLIGDPQKITGFDRGRLRRSDAQRAVSAHLHALFRSRPGRDIRVQGNSRTGNVWRALIRLEMAHAPTWFPFRDSLDSWATKSTNESAKAVAREWLREAHASHGLTNSVVISATELEDLADLALTGPGVVLNRAARRVFGEPADPTMAMKQTLDLSLGALRTYLDEPEFHLTLAAHGRATPNHPSSVRRAVWNGNLEATLDEYFAMHAGLGVEQIDPGREKRAVDALTQALAIRVSSVRTQPLESEDGFRLRCHTAMPFGLTADKDERRGDEGAEARPDALRQAFNSPFRPFVLATTSIGQEGLDFHAYCDHLVHWDLPSSPVDLEQRDGRINRFGGLSIRKALVRNHFANASLLPSGGSPWMMITRALKETSAGMSPWWGTDGAKIQRTVFLPPLAKQDGELARLLASLSHYRLALGQSDPDQLLRALHRRIERAETEDERRALRDWLTGLRIDLAPIRWMPSD